MSGALKYWLGSDLELLSARSIEAVCQDSSILRIRGEPLPITREFLKSIEWFEDQAYLAMLLLVLQHLEKLPSPKAHHDSLYYSSENFPSPCNDECSPLGASRSASKSENSDRCKYSFPLLHWKEEYPIHHKFCFSDRN